MAARATGVESRLDRRLIMNRLVLLFTVVAAALVAAPIDAQASEAAPVAIVAVARGEVALRVGAEARPVRRFDRLDPGAILETRAGAELVIVFRSGARLRVGGDSRVRVEDGRAERLAGVIEPMTPVPTVPLVPAIAAGSRTTTAVRIRSDQIPGLQPDHGATTLADATVLEFGAVAAREYDVEIEDASAIVRFRQRVTATRVEVPPGTLAPGGSYVWKVVAHVPSGFNARGEGRFRTLGAQEAETRARLRAAMGMSDPDALALLAEVDGTLGLVREALDGFRAARAAGATDEVVDERIAGLTRMLNGAAAAPPLR